MTWKFRKANVYVPVCEKRNLTQVLLSEGFVRLLALAAVSLVFSTGTLAQTELGLEGIVVDDSSGEGIAHAEVFIEGTLLGTMTDEQGHFELRGLLPGRYELMARHVAYLPSTAAVDVGKEVREFVRFRLKPRVLLLRSVRVTAEAAGEGQNDLFFSRKDIEQSGATTLGELLRAVPGVEVQNAVTGARIVLRGGNADQVLVLLEGVPLNDPLLGSADVANLPLRWVESVKVVKGPASADYGGGALAGVVELKLRSAVHSGTSLNAALGSYGFRTIGPTVGFRDATHGLLLGVSQMQWQGNYDYSYEIGSESRTDQRVNADYRTQLVGLNLWSYLRAGWLGQAFAHYEEWERGVPGSVYALSPYARSRRQRCLFSSRVKGRVNRDKVELQVAGRLSRTEFRNRVPDDVPVRYRSVPPYDTKATNKDVRVRGHWSRSGGRGKTTAGVELMWLTYRDWDQLRRGVGPVGEAETRAVAAWASWRTACPERGGWVAVPRTELRFDYSEISADQKRRHDRTLSPSLTVEVMRRDGRGVQLHVAVRRAFRLPTYGDLFYQEYRVRGNPSLKPERAWEVSWGLSGKHRRANLRLEWQAVHFRRDVKDQIIWRLGNFASFSPVNVDARVTGEEFSASLRPEQGTWQVGVSADLLRTENLVADPTVHGKALPFRPDFRWKVRVERTCGRVHLAWTHAVTGPRWVTEANTVRLRGFQVDDLVAQTEGELKGFRWRLALSVYNAFDRQYEVLENAPLPGREWRLSVTVSRGEGN